MRTHVALILAIALALSGARGARAEAQSPALVVNGVEASRAEAVFYMFSAQNGYREVAAYYEDFLGVDYWNLKDASGMTVYSMIKADVFRELLMMNVYYEKSKGMGISLSDADARACAEDAQRAYASLTQAQAGKLTPEDIARVLEKQLLADRAYHLLIARTPVDEDAVKAEVNAGDYVLYELEYLYRVNAEIAGDGRLTPISEARKQECLNALNAARELEALISAKAAFPEAELAYDTLRFLSCDTDIDDKLKTAAMSLAPGETSGVIETDTGWFVMRLTDDSSDEGYQAAVESALYEARKAAYQTEYEREYARAEYVFDVQFWDTLSPDGNGGT